MDLEKLRRINFREIIEIEDDDADNYCFEIYNRQGNEHHIKSYCTSCEEKIARISEEEGYGLCNISHGSHSIDFLAASNKEIDTEGWNEDGVMFVMENPSKDYKIYKEVEVTKENGVTYKKHPSKDWYWIHNKQDLLEFPNNFVGHKYGEFVASAILTFRLKNAYLTNLVKCGLNTPDGQLFKGTNSYNQDCVRNCFSMILNNEIQVIKPKVIFAFGRNTFNWLRELTKGVKYDWLCELTEGVQVVMLPHPARCQNGFTHNFYQTLYFCRIAKWLFKTGVITEEFYLELMQKYSATDDFE